MKIITIRNILHYVKNPVISHGKIEQDFDRFKKYGPQNFWEDGRMMNKKRKPNAVLTPVGDIIPGVLKTCRRQPDTELTRIWDLWERIVGKMVAENASPAAFKGKLVIVHVNSPVWVHHLQFLKQDLIGKINEALGKPMVEDIKFKVGPM